MRYIEIAVLVCILGHKKYLKSQDRTTREINRVANFAVISAADNKKLGGKAPSEYKSDMNHSNLGSVLKAAAVPESLFDDDYDAFIEERADELLAHARQLCALD